MREIKFRAWDKEDKKMVEVLRMTFYPNIGWNCCANCGLHIGIYPSRYELMQYTGLKDKNGKEIYEGDIVKFTIPEDERLKTICEIVWDDSGFYQKRLDNGRIMFIGNYTGVIEVIGNIYENPELLED